MAGVKRRGMRERRQVVPNGNAALKKIRKN
jgi:hypothetical protein